MPAERRPTALRDRLQPALLDRLLDHRPGETTEGPEARSIDRAQLRAAVMRDLAWLLNATRAEPAHFSERRQLQAQWAAAPEARRSVLNFGLPALAGSGLAALRAHEIERTVADAIRTFEPRIDPDSLEVRVALQQGDSRHNMLEMVIRARIWGQPLPQDLVVGAEMELESGHTRLRELADKRGGMRSAPPPSP